ncbi:MAG: type II secretion system protein N [Legionella sp.]|jgi:general secretion pathway protein C
MHDFFTGKYARFIVLGLIAFFSLLILIECFRFIFKPTYTIAATPQAPVVKKSESEPYVLNSSLFGAYVPDNLNENSVKKSMLNITVVGILYSNKDKDSQVLLRSANGQEKMYKIGDILPGGVKIERITAGGVLVERNGNLESLSLPKNDLIFEPVPKPLKEE